MKRFTHQVKPTVLNFEQLEERKVLSSNPHLVLDINTAPFTGSIEHITHAGDMIYFTADTPTRGVELWRSDGTDTGTSLVRDIRPGSKSSLPRHLTAVADTVFFTAQDGEKGQQLWASDGTADGTVRLTDMGSAQNDAFPVSPQFTQVGSLLFYLAESSDGLALWVTDGSEQGTKLLKDIPPAESSLKAIADRLYFTVGDELWTTDGSTADTTFISDLPSNSRLTGMHIIQDSLYFFLSRPHGSNPFTGTELWVTDGTAPGTKNVRTLTSFGDHQDSTVLEGKIIVSLGSSSSGQMWVSDGTTEGTKLFTSFTEPATSFIPIGEQLYFIGNRSETGRELWTTDGTSAGTSLVKDIFPGGLPREGWPPGDVPNSSFTEEGRLFEMDNELFFFVQDGETGKELWKSDGTATGTERVRDIRPGAAASSTSAEVLAVLDNQVFFAANDGNGIELWKSDGTEDGTSVVKDLNSGTQPSTPRELTAIGDDVYFTTTTDTYEQLWKSDGTEAGTVLLKQSPFEFLSEFGEVQFEGDPISHLTASGGLLHFLVNQRQYWTSDGSVTRQVAAFGTQGSMPSNIQGFGSGVIFQAFAEGEPYDNDSSVWVSDGSEGGTMRLDLNIPDDCQSASIRGPVTRVKGRYFFAMNVSCEGSSSSPELWMSDGTEAGTTSFNDVVLSSGFFESQGIAAVGDSLYYTVADSVAHTLWKTDGTPAGTVEVATLEGVESVGRLISTGGQLFFTARDEGEFNFQLWGSDGTAEGTLQYKNTSIPDNFHDRQQLASIGDGLVFVDADGAIRYANERSDETVVLKEAFTVGPDFGVTFNSSLFFFVDSQLWVTDGTKEGTVVVDPNAEVGFPFCRPHASEMRCELMASFDGNVYYLQGNSLWRTSGTPDGTSVVHEFSTNEYSSIRNLSSTGGSLFFSAHRRFSSTADLWKTDGTSTGTVLVSEVGVPSSFFPLNSIGRDGVLYFVADDGFSGEEFWKSDGTPEGTVLVKDINQTLVEKLAHSLIAFQEEVVFSTDDTGESFGRRYRLWSTDGTMSGTRPIGSTSLFDDGGNFEEVTKVAEQLFLTRRPMDYSNAPSFDWELWKSNGSSSELIHQVDSGSSTPLPPLHLTDLNGTVFFAANTPDHGRELWTSDGTAASTRMLSDIATGPADGMAADPEFTAMGGTLYFVANDGVHGSELWKSDGTELGSKLVADLSPGPASSPLSELTAVGEMLFFTRVDVSSGRELWRSDGTAEGTSIVIDIVPGAGSSNPSNLQGVRDVLYFSAFDVDANADVLWQSDGTVEGTRPIESADVPLGAGNFTLVNNRVFFTATSADEGEELWVMEFPERLLPGDADGDGSVDFADFLLLAANFGSQADVAFADGDFDGNDAVDFSDFLLLSQNFGRRSSTSLMASTRTITRAGSDVSDGLELSPKSVAVY